MKKVMFALVAVSAASQAWAASGGGKSLDLHYLTNGSSDQTPYQKIEALYNQAEPMQLSQFLTPNDPAIKKGNCVGAQENTTSAQLTPMNDYPARVQGKVVVTPANPGTPSAGPLFPGTPGSPEQDATVDAILLVPNDGSFSNSAEDIGSSITAQKVQLSTSPGVVETFLNDASDANSTVTMTYRITNGLIIVKQDAAEASVEATINGYFYCYQQ